MDIVDLLSGSGGGDSLAKLAGNLNLDSRDMSKLVAAVAPAMTKSLQKQVSDTTGLAGLKNALESGNHAKYIENPELMESTETREDGNKILGHLFGSKDVSRNVAGHAAKSTGIDAGTIKQALPMLASLVMGAMSKKEVAKQPGLLSSLVDSDGDGVDLDDVMGLARKFF